MTPTKVRAAVVADRAAWVGRSVEGIRALPLDSLEAFTSDPRNAAAAESFLRRGLEALLDLGRHVLARGFGRAAAEYRDVGPGLREVGVLGPREAELLRLLAGYRNRMVHFYHQVSDDELYEICRDRLGDLLVVLEGVMGWLKAHPEVVDEGV